MPSASPTCSPCSLPTPLLPPTPHSLPPPFSAPPPILSDAAWNSIPSQITKYSTWNHSPQWATQQCQCCSFAGQGTKYPCAPCLGGNVTEAGAELYLIASGGKRTEGGEEAAEGGGADSCRGSDSGPNLGLGPESDLQQLFAVLSSSIPTSPPPPAPCVLCM